MGATHARGEKSQMKDIIRRVLAEVGKLDVPVASLDDQADLYNAGLSPLTSVHVLLAIETALNIEIPDHMLSRRLFRNIDALASGIGQLCRQQEAA
jgi:acyl carrier protein